MPRNAFTPPAQIPILKTPSSSMYVFCPSCFVSGYWQLAWSFSGCSGFLLLQSNDKAAAAKRSFHCKHSPYPQQTCLVNPSSCHRLAHASIQSRFQPNCHSPSPSPGFSSRGSQRPEGGAKILKYSIGCFQQPVGQTWNGGHRFQMMGPGTTGPPLATALPTSPIYIDITHTIPTSTPMVQKLLLGLAVECTSHNPGTKRALGQRRI